jgi:hypothetical protein
VSGVDQTVDRPAPPPVFLLFIYYVKMILGGVKKKFWIHIVWALVF